MSKVYAEFLSDLSFLIVYYGQYDDTEANEVVRLIKDLQRRVLEVMTVIGSDS